MHMFAFVYQESLVYSGYSLLNVQNNSSKTGQNCSYTIYFFELLNYIVSLL